MQSLFRGGFNKPQATATFEAWIVEEIPGKGPQPVTKSFEVSINSILREDGSGESWCFNGYVVSIDSQKKSMRISGWFRTTDRKGIFKEED